jgi:hypothetical protein
MDNAAPHIRQFMGTINLGFKVNEDKRNDLDVSLILKRFASFAEQMDTDFLTSKGIKKPRR